MKLASRVGVFATAGLMACGSVSVAHATVEEPPEIAPLELSPTISETAGPTDNGASPMHCTTEVSASIITIEFETIHDFTELTVTVAGDQVARENSPAEHVDVDEADATGPMLVELWDENRQRADYCEVPSPSPSPSEEPTDTTPTTPEEPTEPSPTEPTESPEPSDPTPEPSESVVPVPDPTTSSTGGPSPSQPALPPGSTSPTGQNTRPPATPYESTSTAPPYQSENATTPDQRVPRNIRRYSDSPRYLLPQLFGINSRHGSPLIMPRPRDREQQQTDLETLPPISQDELDAIKAQLSSPGRADHAMTDDDLQGAEIDERVADQNSWWLITGTTAVVCVSAGAWWALTRRKRNH